MFDKRKVKKLCSQHKLSLFEAKVDGTSRVRVEIPGYDFFEEESFYKSIAYANMLKRLSKFCDGRWSQIV